MYARSGDADDCEEIDGQETVDSWFGTVGMGQELDRRIRGIDLDGSATLILLHSGMVFAQRRNAT